MWYRLPQDYRAVGSRDDGGSPAPGNREDGPSYLWAGMGNNLTSEQLTNLEQLERLGPKPGMTTVAAGFLMLIDPQDDLDRQFQLGTFDWALEELIKQRVHSGDTCIDIGAQKGYVSLLLGRAVGERGRVLAFEPDPRAREQLSLHAECNHQAIEVFETALGNSEGVCQFTLSKVSGWSSRFPNQFAQSAIAEVVSVPLSSLDALLDHAAVKIDPMNLSFIKIDAEGSEPLILEGMRNLLHVADPTIYMELNYASLAAAGQPVDSLQSLIEGLGYSIYLAEQRPDSRSITLKPWQQRLSLNPPNTLLDVVLEKRGF